MDTFLRIAGLSNPKCIISDTGLGNSRNSNNLWVISFVLVVIQKKYYLLYIISQLILAERKLKYPLCLNLILQIATDLGCPYMLGN